MTLPFIWLSTLSMFSQKQDQKPGQTFALGYYWFCAKEAKIDQPLNLAG
jgi:hypothetical protein